MSLERPDTPLNARSNFDAKCQYGHFGSNKGGTGFMCWRIGKIFARWHLAIAITSLCVSHRVFSKKKPSKLYTLLSPLYTRSACWWNTILQGIRRRGESSHRTPLGFVISLYSTKVYWTNFDDLYNLAENIWPIVSGEFQFILQGSRNTRNLKVPSSRFLEVKRH